MKKNDLIYINHILDFVLKIIEYTTNITESDFLENTLIQDAVIRNFEVIGEASKQISSDFKNKYAFIEWRKIAGMRDKLFHDYIGVDNRALWGVVVQIIPEFKNQLKSIITTEGQNL